MNNEVIVSCAVTGAGDTAKKHPNLPITPQQIADAAIGHLAHTTPAELHFQSSAFHEYTNVVTAEGAPTVKEGYMYCSENPGLGIIPNHKELGNPVLHFFD